MKVYNLVFSCFDNEIKIEEYEIAKETANCYFTTENMKILKIDIDRLDANTNQMYSFSTDTKFFMEELIKRFEGKNRTLKRQFDLNNTIIEYLKKELEKRV